MRVTGTPISGVIPSTPVAWTSPHLLTIATGRILRSYAVDPSSSLHNPLAVLRGHSAAITTVISLPDMRIASASDDGTVRIWDVTTGQSLRIFDLAHPVLHMAYVLSEQLICLTSKSLLHVRLKRDRSKRRHQLVRKLFSETLSTPSRLVVSADATVIAVSDATSIHLTALSTGGTSTTIRCRHVITALAITKDGNTLAAADESGVISLYSNPRNLLGTKRLILPFEKATPTRLHWHAAAPQALSFAHDDSVLLSAGSEAVLVTWRLSPALFGTRTFLPRLRSFVFAVSISPDERLYALSQADNAIRLIDPLSSEVVQTIRAVPTRLLDFSDQNPKALLSSRVNPQYIETCSITRDPEQHGKLWFGGTGSSLQLFDAFDGSLTDEIQVIPRNVIFEGSHAKNDLHGSTSITISDVAVHPSGRYLATIDSQDMHAGHSKRYGTDSAIHSLKFWSRESADRPFLLDAVISQPHGSDYVLSSLCFHPKLPLLATTSRASKTFKLWRATQNGATGKTGWRNEIELEYKGMECNAVCFSSDGSLLVVACRHVLTMWRIEDNLSGGLNETDKVERKITPGYCAVSSPRSISVEFLHVLVHPPAEEQIVSTAFIFKSVPLIVAVTRNSIYVWHALSQSIWWSTRVRSDARRLAADQDSGRFALQLVIPSVGNNGEDFETEPVNGDTMDSKEPAEGATMSPTRRNSEENASSRPNTNVSFLQNSSPRRKVESDRRAPLAKNSVSQGCTDAAIAVYDINSPVPLDVHRLATGANVAALSFVKPPEQTSHSLSTLVCLDSRMEVFLYGADNTATSCSSGTPADLLGASKLKRTGNLERILGRENDDNVLSSTFRSQEHINPRSQSIAEPTTIDEAFRKYFHGSTYVQAPASANSFEFVNTLLTNHQGGQRKQELHLSTRVPESIEAGAYHSGNNSGLDIGVRSPILKTSKTVESPKDTDHGRIRTFCVSMMRKATTKPVTAS